MPIWCYAEDLSYSIAHSLQTKVKLIAIDPGFGGDKTGPSGYCDNVFAKNINLQIAKKVAERIKNNLKIDVILTRVDDSNISLEERASIANTENADLLLSIQVNGSSYPSASGIETYILNLLTSPDVIRSASSKIAQNSNNISEMDSIIQDLMQNSKVNESNNLAINIQKFLIKQLKENDINTRNRGIKHAPFYILLAAQMPAIIVQPGFITNPDECKLLRTYEYQNEISTGIVNGLRAFINERSTQPVNSADPKEPVR
jgi:N-acetylmuramoyl-L-alanine amidase